MKKYNIRTEFGKQAKKFRLHFGLSQKELAKLCNMSPSEYSDLENGVTNYNVEKLQSVSSTYNLFYYQMGNPKCRFPAFSKLPDKTKIVINSREEPVKTYNERLITEHLTFVFAELSKDAEFIIKEISLKINKKFNVFYENEEISGTISKNFAEFVVKTGRQDLNKSGPGAKPFYYQLIKPISEDMINKAKKSLGKE